MRNRRTQFLIPTALLCVALLAVAGRAQTITATVTGTVTDPTGAVVPGATVTVISKETGTTRSVTTDNEGRYTVPFLQPGVYDISVEGAGFARQTRQNIRLEVAQKATIDFTLSATVQEVVEVSGETTPLLITESSGLETTVENKLIEDLPSDNRNIFSFVNLVPGTIDAAVALGNPGGAVGSAGNRNFFDSNFALTGGRASSNDVLLDGVTNTIGDFNGVAVSPPQDSIREFKVQSGVAPAEFGRTAGGIVNIATRAGTNRFHGALYEYFNDGSLNANGWARNRRGVLANGQPALPRIDVSRHQFGGAIGGPVYLPRFGEGGPTYWSGKNTTFFFFNYEARRERNPFSRELTLPTEKMRRGDLSELLGPPRPGITNPDGSPALFGQIYDPYAPLINGQRRPIPGNRLDLLPVCQPGPRTSACLDPVALEVLKYIPLPNQPGLVNNYIFNARTRFTRDIVAARIDRKISDKQSLFGRFSFEKRLDQLPNYFGTPAADARTIRDRFFNFTFNHVYALTSSVINNLRYGYTRAHANQIPASLGFDPTVLGLPAYIRNAAPVLKFPNFTIGGGAQGATLAGEITSGTIGGAGNDQPRDTHMVANSVTVLRGAHSIKTGAEYRLYRFYPFQFFDPTGNFTFARGFTAGPNPGVTPSPVNAAGSSLASFLLGLPTSGSFESVAPISIYKHYAAAFFQDDYKVRRNLTLNLGLRWDIETGTAESHGLITNFDLAAPSPLAGNVPQPSDPVVRRLRPNFTDLRGLLSFVDGPQTRANRNRFAPRLGFAYSINDKTTLRGGYGIFYLPLSLEAPSAQSVNFSTTLTQTSSTTQVGPSTVFLTNPFPAGLSRPTGTALGARTRLGDSVIVVEPRRRTAYNQQWNLVIQRELARNLVLDVGYVGSRGVRLPIQGLNLNQLPPFYLDIARASVGVPGSCPTSTNPNAACTSVAQFFTQSVPNPFAGLLPGTALNAANVPRAQLLRPFPQYQSVTLFRPHMGFSTYHAGVVNLQKRFSDGLSAVVNYVWSKLLDTGGVGNGAAFTDPTSVEDIYSFPQEYSYSTLDVPHRLTVNFTYELPFGRRRRFASDLNGLANLFVGGWQVSGSIFYQSGSPFQIVATGFPVSGLAGIGNATRRPDRVPGISAELSGSKYRQNARAGLPVINTDAFAIPPDFQFGNAARTYDDVRRDTYKNVNLSVLKNFFWNEGRQKLQLRAEFLNAFNFVVFGTPASNVNIAPVPNLANNPNASPGFGQVTTQGNNPRLIQLVVRYTF